MTDIPIIGQTPSLTKLEEQIKEIVKALIIQEQKIYSLYEMLTEHSNDRDIHSHRTNMEDTSNTSMPEVSKEIE